MKFIEGLIFHHDHWLILTAALVCVFGSGLTMLLTRRMVKASGRRRLLQLALNSLIGGATIWSTHFIAMLAHEPGHAHAYEPVITSLSLLIAIIGSAVTNWNLAYSQRPQRFVISGIAFGMTVSLMHYTGMSAYLLPGNMVWDMPRLAASVLFALAAGVLLYRRVKLPLVRFGWLSSTIKMVIAICGMHFIGMSAMSFQIDPLAEVPVSVISDTQLSIVILAVMAVILLVGFASFNIEVSLEHEASRQQKASALIDGLTLLPNRNHLQKVFADLDHLLTRDSTRNLIIATLDLEQFKQVNVKYGNDTGDAVLQTVSKRLLSVLQQDQFVARTGSNEFVALSFQREGQVDPTGFAEKLRKAVEDPIVSNDLWISVGAAIGVVTSDLHGRAIDQLLQSSGVAMRVAKTDPDLKIVLYDARMNCDQREREMLAQDLRGALDRNELSLVFQRQNDLRSLVVSGFEVLLRWTHPTLGPISPGVFIPLAEATGLIHKLGMWVLWSACKEAATWPGDQTIAVNVAPQQLIQPDFAQKVAQVLETTGLPSTRLELEITEASILGDQAHGLKVIGNLRAMGIKIAMDDFGTGYSSLSMLQTIPFDKIKIDRSFIAQVDKTPVRAAIVRSTLLIGAALRIPVLAEGVEDQSELDFLRNEGCDAVQGFFFGTPMSLSEVRNIVGASDLLAAS